MRDVRILLSKLQSFAAYDVRVVSVSPSYVKTEQRVSLDPSSTIQKLVERLFPWIDFDDTDFTIGVGLCTNNEPESMVWSRAKLIRHTQAQDLWPPVALSPNQDYLVVCCQFSREEYNLQKDRLEAVLQSMRKWTPA